jgi:hypothetical protein
MATSIFSRTYLVAEFVALGGPLDENRTLLQGALAALTLSVPVSSLELAPDGTEATLHFAGKPSDADLLAVDAAVAGFAGLPFAFNSFAATTSNSAVEVPKIQALTPTLNAGTYQVIWSSSLRMTPAAANSGVEGKIHIQRSDGVTLEQTDAWDLTSKHAFNGTITFQVDQGQSLQVALSVVRLGAGGVAEMSGARVTVDKIS